MSTKNLGILLVSSFLILGAVPSARSMQTQKTLEEQKDWSPATPSQDTLKDAQQALKDKGLYSGPVDGTMNATLEQSMRDFQSKNNLPVTGALDAKTRTALGMKEEAGNARESAVVSSLEDVRNAQTELKNRGYDPGEINGLMSPATREAVKEFQEANSLPMTGNLDSVTASLLAVGQSTDTHRMKPGNGDNTKDTQVSTEIRERISQSAAALRDSVGSGDHCIPEALIKKADAIVVIPHMLKGAVGVGGVYGKGLIVRRHEDGRWSAPLFATIAGGNLGAQLGASSTDLVLIFTDGKALRPLEDGSGFTFGDGVAVVAGPIGRDLQAGTNSNFNSAVFAYSHSKGLFAGVALNGETIKVDKDANQTIYGPGVDAHQVLTSEYAKMSAKPFMDVVETLAR